MAMTERTEVWSVIRENLIMDTIDKFGERELINRIKRIVDEYGDNELYLDDAARLPYKCQAARLFVTTDPCPLPNLVQHIGMGDYYHGGWLSAVKSISDLAAVGAKPIGLTVAAEFPNSLSLDDFDLFFRGFVECAQEHGTPLVGGNIRDAENKPHAVSFAVGIDETNASLSRGQVRPGDQVYVVEQSDLGGFWAGIAAYLNKNKCADLKREDLEQVYEAALRPRAKVTEGGLLTSNAPPSFCMDASDGILESCAEIAERQRIDVCLNMEHDPFSDSVTKIAQACQADPRVWALAWGGCLLFCVSRPDIVEGARRVLYDHGVKLVIIGEIREGVGQVFININNKLTPFNDLGVFGGERFRKTSFRISKQKDFLETILSSRLEDIIFGS